MSNYHKIFFIVLIPFIFSFSQEERRVLVEIFTNSHCPLCPPAHNVINNYLSGPNGNKINYIYYHMMYPYPDDLLYLHNTLDSEGRDEYYNPPAATPRGFFEGEIQGSYTMWTSTLDNLVTVESPLKINLSGEKMNGSFSINAEITRSGDIPNDDLVIHFVIVEDVSYKGRNGISHHENVMRDMVDGAEGAEFNISNNQTVEVEKEITVHNDWIKDSLEVIVFIQSDSNMTVYQSAAISYSELDDISMSGPGNGLPGEFKLEQNYPNPFNPSTKINYHLPVESFVTLEVYNVAGSEVSILIDNYQASGFHQVSFRPAANLSSGIYFYKLTAIDNSGNRTERTRKMTLIK